MDEFDTDTSFLADDSLSFSNENATHLLHKLEGLVKNIRWSPAAAAELFTALLKRFESKSTIDRSHLLLWMLGMLHCVEINYITSSWRWGSSQTGRTLIQLARDEGVTDEKLKECLASEDDKQLDEILEEIRQQKLNQVDEKLLEEVKDIVSSVVIDLKSSSDGSQRGGLKKDLLRLCRAVQKTARLTPRLTQMVSWCLLALSNSGRLLQIGTGEGKSCVVAMFAAFRAMRGEKVDIMSSSPVLAERDAKDWQMFYKHLNISVDCNINKYQSALKLCYQCQVVYGTVEEFAGDWLKHHFHRMDIFGQREFQCAIVDEVDSLMLDKGLHVVYLSSDMPALQHLNPLLAFIWATVNQYSRIGPTTVGRKRPFHQVVLKHISTGSPVNEFTVLQMAEDAGVLTKGSVEDLRRNPSLLTERTASVTATQLAEFLKTVERRFSSCRLAAHCKNESGKIVELNKEEKGEGQRVPVLLTNGGFCQYMFADEQSLLAAAEAEVKHALRFTPCPMNKDESRCYVPGFLSNLVKTKLQLWIKNAFNANIMTEDHQYVREDHGIAPVDYSCTGVVQNFMHWTDGLHQFLEMKHESKLSDMTAITNYMSNVGLLQKYNDQIYGVSGTLGQQAETETLQKIYGSIKTCQIPSFKRRKLFEVEGVIADNEEQWIEEICRVVLEHTNPTLYRKGRAVLVICETIGRAKALRQALGNKVKNAKLYINNNMDNTQTVAKDLEEGEVIIATNLAGRGTDLKVSRAVKTSGGLFVVQTFLPKNARVEAQAFGRTARQGSPGSAQLIVCALHLSEPCRLLVLTRNLLSLLQSIIDITPFLQADFVMQLRMYQKGNRNEGFMSKILLCILAKKSKSGIKTAKVIRDKLVAEGLAHYLESDIPNMKKKQDLFSHYLSILDNEYKSNPAASHLSALNEFWGMWQLTDFRENDSLMELKNKLSRDLDTARQQLQCRESPLSNLYHYTAFGNELREKGRLAESITMYTKAIQVDHCWAAIAYYNRAFASLALQDRHQDPDCIDRALADLQNALKSVELYCDQTLDTFRYSTQQILNPSTNSTTRFHKHITARYTVLLFFMVNIAEAIKKVERARDRGGYVSVEEKLVFFLVPLVYLLPVASIETVALARTRDPLRIHQFTNRPTFDIINELTQLQSLGLTHVYALDTLFSLGGFFSRIYRTMNQAFR